MAKGPTDVVAGLRSLLFAPAAEERKLVRALAAGAGGVIADLEDSVAPKEKAAARDTVVRIFSNIEAACVRLVRVNAVASDFFAADIDALRALEFDALVLPKADPSSLADLPDGPPIVAIIETAVGLVRAYEVALHPRVIALLLGGVDLSRELRLEARPDAAEMLYARSKVVVESAAARICPPFDVVHLDVGDESGLFDNATLARSLGFGGKACIHPRQVAVVNAAFSPREDELAWAREVVDTYQDAERAGRGAVLVRGEMVDVAVAELARRLLREGGIRDEG